MNKLTTALLKSMISGIEKVGGKCDVVVCGSDERAGEALAALEELGKGDWPVIVDSELSPKRMWVTSQQALSQFSGGGRN
jgi:hypothetical protein